MHLYPWSNWVLFSSGEWFDRYSEGSARYEDDDDFYDDDKADTATSGDETQSEPEPNPKRRRARVRTYSSGEENSEDESLSGKLHFWLALSAFTEQFLSLWASFRSDASCWALIFEKCAHLKSFSRWPSFLCCGSYLAIEMFDIFHAIVWSIYCLTEQVSE
jgi:hypothetical protein